MSSSSCIHCGAALKPGAKFCTACGRAQEVSAPPLAAVGAAGAAAPAATLPAQAARPHGPPPQPVLTIQDEGRLHEVPLAQSPIALGRAPTNDVVLSSRFVSARHARIEPDGAAPTITVGPLGLRPESKAYDQIGVQLGGPIAPAFVCHRALF